MLLSACTAVSLSRALPCSRFAPDSRAALDERARGQRRDKHGRERERRHLPGDQGEESDEDQRRAGIDDHEQEIHDRLTDAITAAVEGIDLPALHFARDRQIVDREKVLEQLEAEIVRDARASPGQEADVGEVEQASADNEQDDADADHDQADVLVEQGRVPGRDPGDDPALGRGALHEQGEKGDQQADA